MRLSVIVPVYNTGKYLPKCLDSILNQTIDDFEIIVVNDGSSDNSVDIIKKYVKKYKDKIVFLDKENGGQGSARNLGIKKAKGDYIGFVDSDDFIDKDMYKEMYDVALNNNSDIVICNISDYYEKNGDEKDTLLDLKSDVSINDAIIKSIPSVVNKIYKKELLQNSNIIFNESIWYEDLPYSMQILVNAKKINFVNKAFYHYFHRVKSTMHNENISKNLDIIKAYDDLINYLKKENLYDKYKEEFDFILLKEVYLSSVNRVIRTNNKSKEKKKIIKELRKYYYSFKVGKTKYFKTLSKAYKISYYLIKLRLYFVLSLIFKMKGRNR